MKKNFRRALSFILVMMMLVSSMSAGLFGMVAIAATSTAVLTDDVIIAVPETVYMTPSTGASTTVQYYVNNTISNQISSASKTIVTPAVENNSKGYVQLYIPGAASFTYSVSAVKGGIGDVVVSGENTAQTVGSDGAAALNETTISINGTGLNAGNTALAEWKFTVTMNDGTTRTYYAYTTLYSPWYQPVGAATRAKSGTQSTFASSILWVSGVHGYSDGSRANSWYIQTSKFIPMLGTITAPGNNNPDTNWLQSGSNGLSPTFSYVSKEGGAFQYHARSNAISPTANLTVDTSRYNNFNQIPNFTVGFMVTDREDSKEGRWFVADYTGKTAGYNNDTAASGDQYQSEFDNTTGDKLSYNDNDNSSGVKYNGTWSKALSNGEFRIKSGVRSYRKSGAIVSTAWNNNFVNINVTGVNKATLRQYIIECASLNEKNYTAASWSAFKTELQNAALALGNPANADRKSVG